jgi:hypothetical protein
MELHNEENNSNQVELPPSKKESSQLPLAEPVSAVPARRLPPREGCAPSFRLKAEADLLEKDISALTFGSCDDPNPMGEGGQKRAQIQEAETKPKRQANKRLFYRAASMVIQAIKTQAGGEQEDPEQPISPSPDSAQQKTTRARWNDKSHKPERQPSQRRLYPVMVKSTSARLNDKPDKLKRQTSQRRLHRAASMQMLAFKASEDPEQPTPPPPNSAQQKTTSARWNDKSDKPKGQPNQRLLHRAASMQGLAFKVSDPVDKDILDDDDDDDEMTAMVDDGGNRPSKKAQETIERFSQSCMSFNFEHETSDGPDVEVFHKSKAQIDDDEPDIEVFRPSPSQRRSSSSRNLKHSIAQVDNDESDEPDFKVFRPSPSQRRLSSSSSQRRLSSSSSQRRLSTSSRRPLKKQEEELTDLSGVKILEESLTDLAPQTRPSDARRVISSDCVRSSEDKSRPNVERSLTDVAHTSSANWERLFTDFERSITDLGLTRSTDVERSLSELKRSLTDFALAKVSDLNLAHPSKERSLSELGAKSLGQQHKTRAGEDSADLRDNTSCSSISVDDLYEEATHARHTDGTHPAPVSHEKEDISPKRPTKREQNEEKNESLDGEPCDSKHFESSLQLSGIYIMSDLKNESNNSSEEFSDSKLHSSERIQEKERSSHDSSKSRNNASLQGSFGSIGVGSRPRALKGGRDKSHSAPKEEHQNRCEPAPTSKPARIRRAPSRSYSMYSGANSFLDDIADVSDEEESTATDRTKEKKSGRRGRRRDETDDAKLARIERETAEKDLHRSLDGSFQFLQFSGPGKNS